MQMIFVDFAPGEILPNATSQNEHKARAACQPSCAPKAAIRSKIGAVALGYTGGTVKTYISLLSLAMLMAFPLVASAEVVPAQVGTSQGMPAEESGVFLLHKFAKEIGKESYSITTDAKGTHLASDFLFTDRGSPVSMKTAFEAGPNLAPISLTEKGKYSRHSEADDSFAVKDSMLSVTHNGKTKTQTVPSRFFLVDGYSPVAMQQEMVRFWLGHERPASLAIPATGAIRIVASEPLTIQRNGKAARLDGYTVSGLIWGVESLWMDEQQNLVALVSTDAEFDHFEAVRDAYEGSLGSFIAAAARDDLVALSRLTAKAKSAPAKMLAITGATLIDGNGGAPVADATVVLTGDTITAVGPRRSVKIPDGATVLDATGKTIIPGLWDMHAHYEQVEWGPIYLAAGVTTARDCGNEFDFITTVRDTIRSGAGIGPQILIAGIVDGVSPITVGAVTASTPEEAIAVVHRYHDAGALQMKIYSSVKPELVPVITAEAHKLGMSVTGHVPTGMTTVQAVEAGMDQINHIQYPAVDLLHGSKKNPFPPLDFSTADAKAQLAVFEAQHTVFDPTMATFELDMHTDDHPVSSFEPGITHVAPQLVAALDTPGTPVKDAKVMSYVYSAFLATLRELHKDGLDIVAGTDQVIPGYSLHRELEIYVQAGFTPMEALEAATTVPARVMGLSKKVGSVEVGKRADLVLLDADPLKDIANTRQVYKTVAAGVVYDPAPLWESVEFRP